MSTDSVMSANDPKNILFDGSIQSNEDALVKNTSTIKEDHKFTFKETGDKNSSLFLNANSAEVSNKNGSLLSNIKSAEVSAYLKENSAEGENVYSRTSDAVRIASVHDNEICRRNGAASNVKTCLPIENDFSDILKCSQFVRTEKKEYSTDAVNLDELDQSVSKILNSAKNVAGTMYEESKSSANTSATKGDHTYHLPLPAMENGDGDISNKAKLQNASNIDKPDVYLKPTLISEPDSSFKNSDGEDSELPINSIQTSVQNVRESDQENISSIKTFVTQLTELKKELIANGDTDTATIEISEPSLPDSKVPSIIEDAGSSDFAPTETDDKLTKEKTESCSVPTALPEPKLRSSNVNADVISAEEEKTTPDHFTKQLASDESGSVDIRPKSPLDERNMSKDVENPSLEESSCIEISYDCNECGAKLKTQNSLFTHKKMHLSGLIASATVLKRKIEATEENEAQKEVKRKRGRPKLIKSEKTVNENDVTPLKENVAKKVLRKMNPSVEVKKSKSKQSANEVKENKISSNDRAARRERALKLREPIVTKVNSNKSKNLLKSENCDISLAKECPKIESVRAKGKTKGFYSSAVSSDLIRKFACPECGAKFKRNDHLKRHQLLHSEKTFKCCDCGMKFYRGDKLKLHTLRHHIKVSSSAPKATLTSKVNAAPKVNVTPKVNLKRVAVVKVSKLSKRSVECHKCGIQFLRIIPPKTDKSGQSRRKNSCCISCGAKMLDENN